MAKIIHTMLRVLQEERSVSFYNDALNLTVSDRFAFEGFTLVYLRNRENDIEIELTINHERTQAYDLGDGYGHIAVAVDDLDAAHARMTRVGVDPAPIKEFFRKGSLMARFFFIQDPDGYKIEILQRHGRYV